LKCQLHKTRTVIRRLSLDSPWARRLAGHRGVAAGRLCVHARLQREQLL